MEKRGLASPMEMQVTNGDTEAQFANMSMRQRYHLQLRHNTESAGFKAPSADVVRGKVVAYDNFP